MKTTLPINLHFNNRRINLLIYCYIMGKISNLKKEHLLQEEDLLHIYIKSLIVSGCNKRSQFK